MNSFEGLRLKAGRPTCFFLTGFPFILDSKEKKSWKEPKWTPCSQILKILQYRLESFLEQIC